MGALIDALDRRFNEEGQSFELRRLAGLLAVLVLLTVTVASAGVVELACLSLPGGPLLLAAAASTLLAGRSLEEHVAAVGEGLARGLAEGRERVSHIVGRNPAALDRAGVARAAIESLAENFSDGAVAPALWFALLGLPGAVLYKATNTADSMLGHRTPRHEAFGFAAARLDDLLNLPAARLSALLLVLAAVLQPGADARAAWHAMRRDARRHRSPNAGWPEAAMAGALGLRLAGPRLYGDMLVADASMGDGRSDADETDIARALALYRTARLMELGLIAATGCLALIARG
jgi:adenosylcobinamide-phosphate synthase